MDRTCMARVCLGQDDERSGRYSAMTVKKASTRCVALRYSLLHCLCVLLLNVLPLSVASSYSDNLRWTCKPVRWILRSLRPVRRCHGRHGPSLVGSHVVGWPWPIHGGPLGNPQDPSARSQDHRHRCPRSWRFPEVNSVNT